MVVFSTSPRLPPASQDASPGSTALFTSFGGPGYPQRCPRLEELLPVAPRPPPPGGGSAYFSNRFRRMAAQCAALERPPPLPSVGGGGPAQGPAVFGTPRPPVPGHVSKADPSTSRHSTRGSWGFAERWPDGGSAVGALVVRTADRNGPARFNVRDVEDARRQRDAAQRSAAFAAPTPKRARPATAAASAEGAFGGGVTGAADEAAVADAGACFQSSRGDFAAPGLCAVHSYGGPLQWPLLRSFHKQQPFQPPVPQPPRPRVAPPTGVAAAEAGAAKPAAPVRVVARAATARHTKVAALPPVL